MSFYCRAGLLVMWWLAGTLLARGAQLHVTIAAARETLRADCVAELQMPQARSMPGRPADRAFDEAMRRMVYGRLDAFKKHLAEAPAANGCEFSVGAHIELQHGDLVSLLFAEESFAGEAHPAHLTSSVLYDFARGRQLLIGDILYASGLRTVAQWCAAELRRKLEVGKPGSMTDADWIRRGTEPTADNYKAFYLTPGALVIVFNEYQVAAYAAGEQRVEIPYAKLRGLLRRGLP